MASWIYEGLFDVLPEEGGDLLTEFWKKEDTSIRIGSMGYRTRTIKAGTRLEAEIYPIFGRQQEATAGEARRNITPERQQQQNTDHRQDRPLVRDQVHVQYREQYEQGNADEHRRGLDHDEAGAAGLAGRRRAGDHHDAENGADEAQREQHHVRPRHKFLHKGHDFLQRPRHLLSSR